MNVFFHHELNDSLIHLSKEESHHCVRVLRKTSGDDVVVIDGKGGIVNGVISLAAKNGVTIEVKEYIQQTQPNCHLHIAIAPTKQMDRFEWFLEKAVELGVSQITPILTFHSERRKLNMDRCEKIILSACKQSLNAYLPKLNALTSFADFYRSDWTNYQSTSIAYVEEADKTVDLKGKLVGNHLVCIGPEGGFTTSEIEQSSFQPVSLGKSRLRTETAGIYAAALFRASQ